MVQDLLRAKLKDHFVNRSYVTVTIPYVCLHTFIFSVPDQFLLYADSLYGHVGLIDVNGSAENDKDLHLIAYSERPVAVAYDPVSQVHVSLSVSGTKRLFCRIILANLLSFNYRS
jgi:hypothetical protein